MLAKGLDTVLASHSVRVPAVGAAQLAWASAVTCAGRFGPAVLGTADDALITRHAGSDTVTGD